MPRVLLYFPFELEDIPSGSGVRPRAMVKAFENSGVGVTVISGSRNERRRKTSMVLRALDTSGFDFVYGEMPSMPTLLADRDHLPRAPLVDFEFLSALKRRNIPIGFFWRDMYWRFRFFYERFGVLKAGVSALFHEIDLLASERLVDIIFVPSMKMAHLFPVRLRTRLRELPPGHDCAAPLAVGRPGTVDDLKFLYVGGVTPPNYDISCALELGKRFPLTICCRADEWSRMEPKYTSRLTAKTSIAHDSGKRLENLYSRANVSLLVRAPHPYLDFAMPLKLFESIGHGLPLLSSPATAAAEFIEKQGVGWLTNSTGDFDFSRMVAEFDEKRRRVLDISRDHRWESRSMAALKCLGMVA